MNQLNALSNRSLSASSTMTYSFTNAQFNSVAFLVERVSSPKNLGVPEGDCPNACVGNPINTAVGNKLQIETDFVGAPDAYLAFRRYYNSQAFGGTAVGEKWRSTYDRKILSPTGSAMAQVYRADGRVDDFRLESGAWVADGDVKSKLSPVPTSGSQTGWKIITADDTAEQYDLSGRLTSMTTRAGLVTTLAYDTGGYLTTVTAPFGNTLTFTYDGNGRVQQMTAPDGGVYTYAYDAKNNLISVTYPGGAVRQYTYTNTAFPNHLTGIIDENGAAYASFTYDANGKAISSQHAGGANLTSVTYNANGSATVTNPNGSTSTFSFIDKLGVLKPSALTGAILPELGAKAFTYDANGYVASKTDFNNNVTTYTHDSRGLELSRTEAYGTPLARTITTTWHSQYHLPLSITEPGRTTSFSYDASGNQLSRSVAAGGETRTWTYSYNGNGQVITVDGPRTDVLDYTSYTSNTAGQIATITLPLGHTTQITSYDGAGRPLAVTDANGVASTLTYDARGRMVSLSKAGETTLYTYDAVGQLTKITRPDGAFISFAYDAANRLTGMADNLGNSITYTLDAAGNRTAEKAYDPSNTLIQSLTHTYDTVNRLAADIGAVGQSTTYSYDNNSNLLAVHNALSQTTSLSYDALDRQSGGVDPLTGTASYAYNALDQLLQVTDPRNLNTGYTVNGLGNRTAQTSPDTAGTTYVYDSAGNLKQSTDAAGRLRTYDYDALNRVTKMTATGISDAVLSYDNGTYGKGHLTGMTDSSGSMSWTYDAQGRLTQQVQSTVGAASRTVSYSYDATGRLTSLTYPSGKIISYGYNANGQISAISLNGTALLSNIVYQPFNGPKGWNWGNGTAYSRSYDADGRLTGYSLSATRSRALTYDAAGRITAYTDSSGSADNQSFTYDANGRLTAWSSGWGDTEAFTYDANGNRVTYQASGYGLTTLSYPAGSNRFSSQTGGTSALTPSYDATGNITSMAGIVYSYDGRNRLASSTGSGISTDYWLNGFGQRVRKTWNGSPPSSLVFVYAADGKLLGTYNLAGVPVEETVFLGDIPVAVLVGNEAWSVYADHLNAPRRVVDGSGATRWAWDRTDPFGKAQPNQNPSGLGSFTWRRRFPGQIYDAETAVYHNGFRDYYPALGRYLQPDPIGLYGGDFNSFAYVGGNPIMGVDPLGLRCTYSQSTGAMRCVNDAGRIYYEGGGYAGTGDGRNNPDAQDRQSEGPLPRGEWRLEGDWRNSPNTGRNTMTLAPLLNNECANTERDCSSFRIHGDNRRHDASEGCIVLPPNRTTIPSGEIVEVVR